jgi:replicative DNA helicase
VVQSLPRVVRSNRIPPHNLDAEQSVLGAMLESREAIANVLEILDPEDFYKPAHSTIYEAILGLFGKGEPVDAITVADELTRRGHLEGIGGKPYIHGLLEAYPTASSAAHYAHIVDEHAMLRRLVSAGNEIQEIGFALPDDVPQAVDRSEELIYEVGNRRLRGDVAPLRGLLTEAMVDIETLYERGEPITGVTTGFHDLDEITTGFQPSNLIIVAARPSMGKSSVLSDFALAAAKNSQPVVMFSLEMSRQEVVQRFLSSEARVDSQRIRKGTLQEQDWPRLSAALGRLAELPIFIDDSANVSIMEMRAKCRRLKARHGLSLVIIDYLQLMQTTSRSENRQQEVSEISRALKILARDLEVPVLCASQLNRGVEYRADKRPLLADLRESGCLVGSTRVALASGDTVPIEELVGQTPEVVTFDGLKAVTGRASKVWKTGTRQAFCLTTRTGRVIEATDNHSFRVLSGWRALGDLRPGERIAVPRMTPDRPELEGWSDAQIVLLGHLIGDGCYVSGQPLHYTSASEQNITAVQEAAKEAFGMAGRRVPQKTWTHLYLSAGANKWHPNPIKLWLRELGIDGQRSKEKHIPESTFGFSNRQSALLLRHLWATDGCVWMNPHAKGPRARLYYASSSRRLASQVQHLLMRIGIVARVKDVGKEGYGGSFHVTISGLTDQLKFAERIGGHGDRSTALEMLVELARTMKPNTNVDTTPIEVWREVKQAMVREKVTQREMASLRGTTYGGTSHFRFAPSRKLLAQYADIPQDGDLRAISESDVYWDSVESIEPSGVEDVYDMTVPGMHNFVANDLVVHNSIEQDSDVVMFLYRDEVYNPDTDARGEAELIIGKHRNGPTGVVRLAFMNQYTKFASIAKGI